MSPQQAVGKTATITDDIYALGATLYDLLSGRPPFYTGNIYEQVKQERAPLLRERRGELGVEGQEIPESWEQTIAACLEKDPALRPQNAQDVAYRLGLIEHYTPRPTPEIPKPEMIRVPVMPSPEPKTTGRKGALTAVLLALLAGGGVGGWWWGYELPRRERQQQAAAAQIVANTKHDAAMIRATPPPAPAAIPAPAPVTQPGSIRLDSSPPGALAQLGDANPRPCPASFPDLKPGTYHLRVSQSGYEDVVREVEVRAGEPTDVGVIKLILGFGTLELTSTPSGADFVVLPADHPPGSDPNLPPLPFSGKTPFRQKLPAGEYAVTVSRDGFETTQLVRVAANETITHAPKISPVAIAITSEPAGAAVYEDFRRGKLHGHTPLVLENEPPGTNMFWVAADGYAGVEVKGDARSGEELSLTAKLKPSSDLDISFIEPIVALWRKVPVLETQLETGLNLGEAFLKAGQIDRAVGLFDECHSLLLHQRQLDPSRADDFSYRRTSLADDFFACGQIAKARELIEEVLADVQKFGKDSPDSWAAREQQCFFSPALQGDPQKALPILDARWKTSAANKWKDAAGWAGAYAAVSKEKAAELADKIGDPAIRLQALEDIAADYKRDNDYPRATALYEKAWSLKVPESKEWNYEMYVRAIEQRTRNREKALETISQEVRLLVADDDAYKWSTMVGAYVACGLYRDAVTVAGRRPAKEADDGSVTMADAWNQIAADAHQRGLNRMTVRALDRAQAAAGQIHDPIRQAMEFNAIASSCIDAEQPVKAQELTALAIDIGAKANRPFKVDDVFASAIRNYIKMDRFDLALGLIPKVEERVPLLCELANEWIVKPPKPDQELLARLASATGAAEEELRTWALPRTLVVPDDFAKISGALQKARSGDTVRVKAGIYEEGLTLKEGVHLVGESKDTVTIRVPATMSALYADACRSGSASGLTFEHATKTHAGNRYALVALNNSSVEISDCVIRRPDGYGIWIRNHGESVIRDCVLEDGEWNGIVVESGANPSLKSNRCSKFDGGILFQSGGGGTAEGNICTDNNGGIYALELGTKPTVKDNTARDNKFIGIAFAGGAGGMIEGNTCDSNGKAGIRVMGKGTSPRMIRNHANNNGGWGIEVESVSTPAAFEGNTAHWKQSRLH